jgi:hypothetical protein
MSYYIQYNGIYYKLDATSDIQVTYPARTTSHPTHSKKTASDNYILDNPTATVNGIITDVKTARSLNRLGAGEYIDELLAIRGQRVPVGFKHRLDGEEEDNWFITSFSAKQDNQNGFGGVDREGNVVQSFKVNMTLERVTQARGLRTDVTVPVGFIDALSEKGTSSKSTQSFGDTKSEETKIEESYRIAREQAELARKAGTELLGDSE